MEHTANHDAETGVTLSPTYKLLLQKQIKWSKIITISMLIIYAIFMLYLLLIFYMLIRNDGHFKNPIQSIFCIIGLHIIMYISFLLHKSAKNTEMGLLNNDQLLIEKGIKYLGQVLKTSGIFLMGSLVLFILSVIVMYCMILMN